MKGLKIRNAFGVYYLCDGVGPDDKGFYIGKIFAEFATFEEAKKVRDEIEALYK
jgi:hypothetical protein